MSVLLRWITARHLGREPGATALSVFGVALGVAVYVAIRLANGSALASFRSTVDAVAGTANLQVSADDAGLDERLFLRVRRVPGVLAAAPVVQALAPVAGPAMPAQGRRSPVGEASELGEVILLLGVDLFSEIEFERYPISPHDAAEGREFLADPHGVAVTQSLARRLSLRIGDVLPLMAGTRRVELTVRAILSGDLEQAMGGSVALVDIATSQEIFGRLGRLDRIDLRVEESERERVIGALQALLPPNARVARPEGRTQQVENMLRAFQLNLMALSCIALFVAAFLILNAISMSVVRRRREIGILRTLGVTRRQIQAIFLIEATLQGLLGSALGLGLGILMARATLGSVSETITALYLAVQARTVVVAPEVLWQGAILGVGAALVAALAPAREAATTPPGATMRQGMLIERHALPIRAWSILGLLALVASLATAILALQWERPLLGFASAFLLMTGFSLLTPAATVGLERAFAPAVRALFGIEGTLGARYLVDSLARTAIVTAALMIAVGMLVGLTLMVGSFRDTVDTWVT
jgi:putative ABC transport system permease protein